MAKVDITLRDHPIQLKEGAHQVARILHGATVVQLERPGKGHWVKVSCGEDVGWTEVDNGGRGGKLQLWLAEK